MVKATELDLYDAVPDATTDYMLTIVAGAGPKRVPMRRAPVSDAVQTELDDRPNTLAVQALIASGGQAQGPRLVVVDNADYTLTLADLQRATIATPTCVVINSSAPRVLTWPTQGSVPHALLATVVVYQAGNGDITLRGGTSTGQAVLMRSAKGLETAGPGSKVTLAAIANNVVNADGDLVLSGAPALASKGTVALNFVRGSVLTLTPSTTTPGGGTDVKQWLRQNRSTLALTNIGTDSVNYTSVAADDNNWAFVRETITLGNFPPVIIESNKQRIVPSGVATPQWGTLPSFVGSAAAVGDAYSVDAGDWSASPTSYDFQKRLDGVNSGAVVNQAARLLAQTVQAGDAGKAVSWQVKGVNASGTSTDADAATPNAIVIAAGGIPANTVQPVITYSGNPNPGTQLTVSTGGWTGNPTSYLYRWRFVEDANPSITGDIEPPQTANTYTITSADASPASRLLCRVVAVNAAGRSDALGLITEAVGPVAVLAAPAPPPPAPPPSAPPGPRFATNASGPIVVSTNNQLIERFRITAGGAGGHGIVINPGVIGTIVQDNNVSGCAGNAILDQGVGTVIRYNNVDTSGRGILCYGAANSQVYKNTASNFQTGGGGLGTAIEVDYCNGVTVSDNEVSGTAYASDAVSFFQSSYCRLENNIINVDIANLYGAAFTMGDMVPISEGGSGDPGSNNYVVGNEVYQTGGVPAGVFGSSGNTVLEFNCLTAGIQAYNYTGIFVGVAVRNNYIDMAASYIRDANELSGWGTNTDLGTSNVCP